MLVENILEALKILKELQAKKYEEIEKDKILIGSIVWYLYVAVQGSIDLALKVISLLNLRIPESYSDAFKILEEEDILPRSLVEKLVTMVRFRHVIAHAYAKIDLRKIYKILHENLNDIEEYIRCLKERLKSRGIDITKL